MGTMSIDDYDTGTRAAAAGGVTCLVDFAIQQRADSLRSALEEWQGRAAGAAHVDYGFHMAIIERQRRRRSTRCRAMVEARRARSSCFMAYKGELMVRDDEMRGGDGARPRPRRADHGARRERRRRRPARPARAGRGQTRRAIHHALTRPEFVEAEATGRAARLAEYTGASLFVVHVTCAAAAAEIEAAQQRGVARQRRDLHAVPRQHDRRPAPAGRRGLSLHLLAAAARRVQPRAAVGLPAPRRAGERLDRPLPVQRRAEGPRPGRLQPRPQRPAGDPAPAGQAVGRGRRRRADHAEPARRPHEHDDRAPLRPGRQGRDRAGQGRRRRRLRPAARRARTAWRRRS